MCISNTTLTLNVKDTMLAVTQMSLYTKGQGLYTEERLGSQLGSPLIKLLFFFKSNYYKLYDLVVLS